MLAVNNARLHDGRDPCLQLALAQPVFNGNPITVLNTVGLSVNGVDGDLCPLVNLTQGIDVTMLRVERGVLTATGGQNQRVLMGLK